MKFPTIDECKSDLKKIISRVVVKEEDKNRILDLLFLDPKILPMKAILEELESVATLKLTDDEKEILQDIKFIYI